MTERLVRRAAQIAVLLCADIAILWYLTAERVAWRGDQTFELVRAGAGVGAALAVLALAAVLTRHRILGGLALLLALVRLLIVLGAAAFIHPITGYAFFFALLDATAGLAAGFMANSGTQNL